MGHTSWLQTLAVSRGPGPAAERREGGARASALATSENRAQGRMFHVKHFLDFKQNTRLSQNCAFLLPAPLFRLRDQNRHAKGVPTRRERRRDSGMGIGSRQVQPGSAVTCLASSSPSHKTTCPPMFTLYLAQSRSW